MKSVVSVYTGFYSQTVKVSIVVPRKEQARLGDAHRWCAVVFLERAMSGCSHFKVERRLRLYGAITVVYCKLVCGRVVPLFPRRSRFRLSLPLTQPSSPSLFLFSRKRRVRVHVRSIRRQAFDRHFDAALNFRFRFPVQSKVRCSEQWMEVDIVRSSPQARIYLQQMKDFPGKDRFVSCICKIRSVDRRVAVRYRSGKRWYTCRILQGGTYLPLADEACKPRLSNGVATFRLPLLEEDMLRCGITRVVNKVTVSHNYDQRIKLSFLE